MLWYEIRKLFEMKRKYNWEDKDWNTLKEFMGLLQARTVLVTDPRACEQILNKTLRELLSHFQIPESDMDEFFHTGESKNNYLFDIVHAFTLADDSF